MPVESLNAGPSTSPLCPRCQTNLTLGVNYRANYLPEQDTLSGGDDDEALLADFGADYDAFQRTFPPLCESCRPRVDEVIRKKDYKAQVTAWSLALSQKQDRTEDVHAPISPEMDDNDRKEVALWAARGGLFCVSVVYEIYGKLSGEESQMCGNLRALIIVLRSSRGQLERPSHLMDPRLDLLHCMGPIQADRPSKRSRGQRQESMGPDSVVRLYATCRLDRHRGILDAINGGPLLAIPARRSCLSVGRDRALDQRSTTRLAQTAFHNTPSANQPTFDADTRSLGINSERSAFSREEARSVQLA